MITRRRCRSRRSTMPRPRPSLSFTSVPVSDCKEHLVVSDRRVRKQWGRRTKRSHGVGDLRGAFDEGPNEKAFQDLLALHRRWNEMQPDRSPAYRGHGARPRRATNDREGSIESRLEPALAQERAQFPAREVTGAQRTRIEIGPLAVDRRYHQATRSAEHALGLYHESAGLAKIVQRFEDDHCAEARRAKRERLRVQLYERDLALVVVRGPRQERRGVVAAHHSTRAFCQVAESGPGAARDLQHVAALDESGPERVARVEHRERLGGEAVAHNLRDR